MSLYVKNRRYYEHSVRTWFSCDRCGMYGDYTMPTIEEATALLDLMDRLHECVMVSDLTESL